MKPLKFKILIFFFLLYSVFAYSQRKNLIVKMKSGDLIEGRGDYTTNGTIKIKTNRKSPKKILDLDDVDYFLTLNRKDTTKYKYLEIENKNTKIVLEAIDEGPISLYYRTSTIQSGGGFGRGEFPTQLDEYFIRNKNERMVNMYIKKLGLKEKTLKDFSECDFFKDKLIPVKVSHNELITLVRMYNLNCQ